MNETEVRGLLAVATIPVSALWRLPNGYITTRDDESDEDILKEAVYRHRRPAWLVKTPWGLIEITERKRVVDLSWAQTPFRGIITEDEVTKGDTHVHAWTTEKLVSYLLALAEKFKQLRFSESTVPEEMVDRALVVLKADWHGFARDPGMNDAARRYMLRKMLGAALAEPVKADAAGPGTTAFEQFASPH